MPLTQPPFARNLALLAVLGLSAIPVAAQAELRPAILPAEICLVLANGPFDADIAARIQARDDFADILLEAEATCPDLAGNLVGATATIPATVPNSDTDGPSNPPVVTATPPVDTPVPTEEEPVDETPVDEEPGGGTDPSDFLTRAE